MKIGSLHFRYGIVYCLLLLLVLIDRWLLLQHFTFQYVDDDQSIMWYAAKEFASGNFYEPCFYGQAYNTLFESLVSVPLIWCGVSYPVALTVTMSVLTLAPFVFLSHILLRKQMGIQALLVLSIPLLLPVEYGMITAISRGVITGTFFGALAIIPLFTRYRGDFFFFGLFAGLAVFANPSTVILLFPAGVYLLAEHFRIRSFYLQTIVGIIPGAIIWFFTLHFYETHPDYLAHGSLHQNLEMSLSIIKPYEWNKFFNYVMPAFWGLGFLVFPVLLVIAILLFRQGETKAGYSLLAGIVLLFFSLTILRVHHGFPTVFLSWARMFTTIPLIFALYLSRITFSPRIHNLAGIILLISGTYFILKSFSVDNIVRREIEEKTEHAMYVTRIADLEILCDTIQRCATINNVDLIVVGNHPTKHVINYACPCLEDGLPLTIEPLLDRRRWLLNAEENQVRRNVLFVGMFHESVPEELSNFSSVEIVSEEPLMILLRNNSLPTSELLLLTGLPMR